MKTKIPAVRALWTLISLLALAGLIYAMTLSANVLVLGLGLLASLPFWAWAVYLSAKTDRQFTFRRTGEIKFSKDGEVIDTVIAHVPGFYYDEAEDLMKPVEGAAPAPEASSRFSHLVRRLASVFSKQAKEDKDGLVLVSLLYPYRKIHTWKFVWTKFVSKTHSEADRDRVFDDWIVVEREEEKVSSLYFEYVYPIVVKEVDLKGKIQIKILLQVRLRIRKPLHLIGFYKGTYISTVTSEVKGIVDNEIGHSKDIDQWFDADKEDIIDGLLQPGMPLLGGDIELVEARYVSFDFDGPNAEENRKAAALKEINRLKGEAKIMDEEKEAEAEKHRAARTVTAAKGRADAAEHDAKGKIAIAKADAEEVRMTLAEASQHPQGVDLLIARERTAAVAAFGGSTLILDGGGRGNVMVAAEGDAPRRDRPRDDKSKKGKSEGDKPASPEVSS